jgi:serine/threonine protein kinase
MCKQCLQPLPANAAERLCPQCLAKVALGSEPASTGPRIAPDIAQLAPQFPQLEILELLGMGGMGMVYKARQPRVDRLVALKILPVDLARDPAFAERFEREAKALAKLNHPGIVTLHDFGQTREYYYFIMEYVDGMNLRQLLQSQTLESRQALELVTQICTALQFAHDENIVHRDVKPENILITKKGQVKIADFGLAKLLGGKPDTALTASQMVMGTLNYMAPEQREKPLEVDHRADIYSLGVVFYEMLTGEVPMGRFDAPSKKVQIDVRLDEVVLRALEREPARRYQQASEIKSGVDAITSTGPAKPTPVAASGKVPCRFWLKAYALFTAGWLVTKLLWNFRGPGCWLACIGMSALAVWVSMKRMRLFPEQLALYYKITPFKRWFNSATCFVFLTFGFIFLISAFFNFWEYEPMHGNMLMKSAAEYEAQYKGKEYQAIRNLAAFSQDIPNVEMMAESWNSPGWSVGWWPRPPGNHDFNITPNLLEGGLLLLWLPFCLIGAWRVPGMPWLPFSWRHARAALAVSAIVFSSVLPIYALSELTYGNVVSVATSFFCNASPEAVTEAIQKWADQNGYAMGESNNWIFNTVPKGKCVAEARLREAWKPSPFDRWRSTWTSFHPLAPRLCFEMVSAVEVVPDDSKRPHWKTGFEVVSSAGPPQTIVGVSCSLADQIPPDLLTLLRKL